MKKQECGSYDYQMSQENIVVSVVCKWDDNRFLILLQMIPLKNLFINEAVFVRRQEHNLKSCTSSTFSAHTWLVWTDVIIISSFFRFPSIK
jgi:hypothetical protein